MTERTAATSGTAEAGDERLHVLLAHPHGALCGMNDGDLAEVNQLSDCARLKSELMGGFLDT